jgi:hypothetical protein
MEAKAKEMERKAIFFKPRNAMHIAPPIIIQGKKGS